MKTKYDEYANRTERKIVFVLTDQYIVHALYWMY